MDCKTAIIGKGNVGRRLATLLRSVGHDVVSLSSRAPSIPLPQDVELCIIAVADKAIRQVADALADDIRCTVAHTSGSVSISVLEKFSNPAVLYPLQTISHDRPPTLKGIHWFLESPSAESLQLLKRLVEGVDGISHTADSETRRQIHLSAVIASNFTNALWALSDQMLQDSGYDIGILKPLLQETLDKAMSLGPHEAQTGPARRNDIPVIDNHLEMLEKQPSLREIYKLMSQIIINRYNK